MWWNERTGSWSWTEQTQNEAEENGRPGDHTSEDHVDNDKNQQRICWMHNLCAYI